MNLRPPNWLDFEFFKECYSVWPVTEQNPPVLESHVWNYVNRWMHRSDEICLVGEESVPVGFITYRRGDSRVIDMRHAVVVDNLAVHPSHRRRGYANAIVRALRDRLVADGVTVAVFDALQGPIADQIERGRYDRLGEVQGKTGTLLRGRLTADMDI